MIRSAVLRSIILPLTLAVALGLAWLASQTPRPAPADSVPTRFSAERAQMDVREVARRPHPTGSLRNAEVRDYLVERLKKLGFATEVQTARAMEARGSYVSGADLENIVGVLKGTDPAAPAVALMAHYDSVPGSPGGSDDAAGVAAALEAARAIKAAGSTRRDLVVVFTDGEEIGLLGAKAFFEEHPLARRVGAVLNMDTRGGGGRAYMFETSNRNGALIDLFRRTAVRPSSTSLAVFLYQHMPNGTDFTIPKDRGVVGMNYAFIGRQFDYHSPNSTAESLEPGALQHMGEQVLAAGRALAAAETLPEPREDAVYADLFGGPIIAYPPVAGWLVLALCAGVVGFLVAQLRSRGAFLWPELLRGAGGALYLLMAFALAFSLAREATGVSHDFVEGRRLLALFGHYEAALGLTALAVLILGCAAFRGGRARWIASGAALALGLMVWLLDRSLLALGLGLAAAILGVFAFARPARPWGAWAGFLLTAVLLAALAQALAPGAAFLIAWPTLLAGLLGVVAVFAGGAFDRPGAVPFLAVGAAVGLAWLLYMAHPVTLGIGADLPPALALFAWLAALLLAPLAFIVPRPLAAGGGALALAALVTAVIALHDPTSAAKPRPTHVLYVADPPAGRAWRTTALDAPDAWTRAALTAGGAKLGRETLTPLSREPVWAAPAPFLDQPGRAVSVSTAGGRTLVTPAAPAGSNRLTLALRSDVALSDVQVDGRPAALLAAPGKWSYVVWSGPEGRAAAWPVVSFRSPGRGKLEARALFLQPGWPAGAPPLPPRGPELMAWSSSDSTAVLARTDFSWPAP